MPLSQWACTQAAHSAMRTLSRQRPIFVTWEMARLEGFEPPTNGFGSRYSIQLSYRRVFKGLFPAVARSAEQWPCDASRPHCRG